MSLRAELVRLGLRWRMKRRTGPPTTIIRQREQEANWERWVPRPPVGTAIAERELGGIPALRIAIPAARSSRHILFLHGGGYVTGTPGLYRHLLARLATAATARVAAIAYRLAPEHPFPAAVDDAVAAWGGLLAEGVDPRQVTIVGDSAGGGLALALALRLRDEGAPLPAALALMSPWTDLAVTGESVRCNAGADPMLNADDVPVLAARYLNGADPRHPYASPLYGDPKGLPPSLIQVGSDEILRDDSVRMAERLREAGCAVDLEVWPRMPHVFQAFVMFMPEARRALARIAAFIVQHTAEELR